MALKDKGQNTTHYTSIMRNISKRKTAQDEIKKRIKELEEFYDMAVGRELRTKELKEANGGDEGRNRTFKTGIG